MISFLEQAQQYSTYHQKPLTRYIQMISIPLIFLAFMILLSCVHVIIPGLLDINVACIAAIGLLVYYFRLNWRLALIVTPLFILLWWVAGLFSHPNPTFFTLLTFLIVFALGGLLRFAGFYMEGRRPIFIDNIKQTVIGPLVIATELIFMTGSMLDLKAAMYGKDA